MLVGPSVGMTFLLSNCLQFKNAKKAEWDGPTNWPTRWRWVACTNSKIHLFCNSVRAGMDGHRQKNEWRKNHRGEGAGSAPPMMKKKRRLWTESPNCVVTKNDVDRRDSLRHEERENARGRLVRMESGPHTGGMYWKEGTPAPLMMHYGPG